MSEFTFSAELSLLVSSSECYLLGEHPPKPFDYAQRERTGVGIPVYTAKAVLDRHSVQPEQLLQDYRTTPVCDICQAWPHGLVSTCAPIQQTVKVLPSASSAANAVEHNQHGCQVRSAGFILLCSLWTLFCLHCLPGSGARPPSCTAYSATVAAGPGPTSAE